MTDDRMALVELIEKSADSSRATAPGLTVALISIRWWFMASTPTYGITTAAPAPRAGQMAPNRWAQVKRRSRRMRGRDPRAAHRRVSVPCWPTRASSWNHTSTGRPARSCGMASRASVATSF